MAAEDPAAAPHAEGMAGERTELLPHLAWIWRAWWRLSHDRPMHSAGMGGSYPGRIAWRDVMAWCDRDGRTEFEAEVCDLCFAAMDTVFLEWTAEQREKG